MKFNEGDQKQCERNESTQRDCQILREKKSAETKDPTDVDHHLKLAGGVSFEGLTAESIPQHSEVLEKAVRKMRGRVMPPPGAKQPDAATLATVAGEVPTSTATLPAALVDLLAATGLAASKSEAARVVKQGGAYVNNEKWPDGGEVGPSHVLHGQYVLLRRGKDQYHLVTIPPRG